MDALEVEHGLEHELEDNVNCTVEAAAQLFIYAADELYRRCKDRYPERLRPGVLWHNGNGYSEERWGFWREQWIVISVGGREQKACAAAKAALEAMERVEIFER